MYIRPLTPQDLDQVAMIETSSHSPWSQSSLCSELLRAGGEQYVVVREDNSAVIGWCAVLVVAGEAELLKIAVSELYRKQGVAFFLLSDLLEKLAQQCVQDVFLEVRETNIPAYRLYRKLGFQQVGTRPKYYQNPPDDALIFAKHIAYSA